jgi:hypothetical protein
MNIRTRIRGLVVLTAIIAGVVGGATMLASPAHAARCCKVMVCSPYACWEECRTCPKFP